MPVKEAEARASAAPGVGGRRNLPGTGGGVEAGKTAGEQTKPEALRLMAAVVERSNMLCAYKRVVKNQGAPGVDGLATTELKPWLQAHWEKIRRNCWRAGTCRRRCARWKYRSRKAGYEPWAFRRCWTGSSNKHCIRYCNRCSNLSSLSPAMAFALDATRTKP